MADQIERLLRFVIGNGEARTAHLKLMNDFCELHRLFSAHPTEIDQVKYLSEDARELIKTVSSIIQDFTRVSVMGRPILPSDPQLGEYLRSICGHSPVECARVIYLDAESRIVADEEVGRGAPFRVGVSTRAIIKRALQMEAAAIILVHSHPSGDLIPGHEDVQTTRNIRVAANAVDVALLDHLIVTRNGHVSMREAGYLN